MRVRRHIRQLGMGRSAGSLRAVWAPSLARRIVRHRGAQAGFILVAGVATAVSLSAKVDAVEAARASWGDRSSVAVVVAPISVGEPVADSISFRELPVELVPVNAVQSVTVHSLAKVALFPGEVVLEPRITHAGHGEHGELDPGTVALTMPVVTHVPLVDVGDLVDLWVVDNANLSSRRVAERVVVLALGDREITVAVAEDDVAEAAVASVRPVTVTLVG